MRRSPTPSRTLGSVDAFSIVPTQILSGFIRRRLAEFRHGAVRLHLPNGDVIEHRGEAVQVSRHGGDRVALLGQFEQGGGVTPRHARRCMFLSRHVTINSLWLFCGFPDLRADRISA